MKFAAILIPFLLIGGCCCPRAMDSEPEPEETKVETTEEQPRGEAR